MDTFQKSINYIKNKFKVPNSIVFMFVNGLYDDGLLNDFIKSKDSIKCHQFLMFMYKHDWCDSLILYNDVYFPVRVIEVTNGNAKILVNVSVDLLNDVLDIENSQRDYQIDNTIYCYIPENYFYLPKRDLELYIKGKF